MQDQRGCSQFFYCIHVTRRTNVPLQGKYHAQQHFCLLINSPSAHLVNFQSSDPQHFNPLTQTAEQCQIPLYEHKDGFVSQRHLHSSNERLGVHLIPMHVTGYMRLFSKIELERVGEPEWPECLWTVHSPKRAIAKPQDLRALDPQRKMEESESGQPS